MAENVYLPRLGQTMKEGTLVNWLKKDGESVKKGEEIYTLEYDKATINVESTADGILKIEVEDGRTVDVGTVVAVILEENEAAGQAGRPNESKKAENQSNSERVKASPLAKRTAKEQGIDIKNVALKFPSKFIIRKDVLQYIPNESVKAAGEPAEKPERVKVSPLAKKLAEEYKVDISKVQASDPSGRISKEDVIHYYEQTKSMPAAAEPVSNDAGNTGSDAVARDNQQMNKVPMSGIRKVIAQRMCASAAAAPTVTYCTDVDMQEMKRMREKLNGTQGNEYRKVSFNDLIVKAVATALKQNPQINVSLQDEYICYLSEVNIGVAVATEKGLLVPVIKGADKLSINELAMRSQELAQKAREGTLNGNDMSGGSFTISNLGMLEIDVFTPIINQPESAILGVGRIIDKPVVVENQITIRPMMVLSLTADHRVIDGAPAAEFLREIKKFIECPYLMMR